MKLPSYVTHLVNVRKGDCIIIEWQNHSKEKVLGIIDCNNSKYLVNYLQHENIIPEKVAFVAVTHPHYDHHYGLIDVINFFQTMGVKVEEFWHCRLPLYSASYGNLVKFVENEGIKKKGIKAKKVRKKHGLEFAFLAPPGDFGEVINSNKFLRSGGIKRLTNTDINNASIVMSVYRGNVRVLLGADAERRCWAFIENKTYRYLKAGVLKVPHHGSKNGNLPQQLKDRINPNCAVISGLHSLWAPDRFPSQETLNHLGTVANIKIYCTRDHGNIKIESGRTHSVTTEINNPPYIP